MKIRVRGNNVLVVENAFDIFTVKANEDVLVNLYDGLVGIREGKCDRFIVPVTSDNDLFGQLEDGVLLIACSRHPRTHRVHAITNYKANNSTDIILDEMITVLQRVLA